MFHEFRRNLYIPLANCLEQESVADLLFFQVFDTQSSQVLVHFHETKVAGMIVCTRFSLPLDLV